MKKLGVTQNLFAELQKCLRKCDYPRGMTLRKIQAEDPLHHRGQSILEVIMAHLAQYNLLDDLGEYDIHGRDFSTLTCSANELYTINLLAWASKTEAQKLLVSKRDYCYQ